ncbi:hypothetical protein JCM8208_005256 [Rhodotorula glutinis]
MSMMDLAAAAAHTHPPRRLPDELVLMVVDRCNDLRPEWARTRALAALCRLARRYHAHAERLLYSYIRLVDEHAARLERGSLLHALVHNAPLRRHVRSVEVGSPVHYFPLKRVRHVLENLPNVAYVYGWDGGQRAVRVILAQKNLKLRRLGFDEAFELNGMIELVGRRVELPATLVHLDIDHLFGYIPIDSALDCLSAITSFGISRTPFPSDWTRFIAPFRANLVTLRLPVFLESDRMDLGVFPHLRCLVFYALGGDEGGDPCLHSKGLSYVVPYLVQCLLSGAAIASFTSFALHGAHLDPHDPDHDPQHRLYERAPRSGAPSCTSQILDALPARLEHLSLTTSFLHPADVAAYLLGPLRPPALRTLRIGGEVGRGLGAILRGEFNVGEGSGTSSEAREEGEGFGALAGVLERAGVEVTTVE